MYVCWPDLVIYKTPAFFRRHEEGEKLCVDTCLISKYTVFWSECKEIKPRVVGNACNDTIIIFFVHSVSPLSSSLEVLHVTSVTKCHPQNHQ
jgi:hypothetical protein